MWPVDATVGLPPAVQVVQLAQAQEKPTRAAGICALANATTEAVPKRIVGARGVASTYMYRFEKVQMDFGTPDTKVTIVRPPEHGKLRVVGLSENYTPAPNYSGADTFVMRVRKGDVAVLVHYHVFVVDRPTSPEAVCDTIKSKPANTNPWRISESAAPVQTAGNSWLLSDELARVVAAPAGGLLLQQAASLVSSRLAPDQQSPTGSG